GEPPFADAGTLHDPLVVGVDEVLEEGVRDDAAGEGGTGGRDGGEPPAGLGHSRSTHATAWPGVTSSPSRPSTAPSLPRTGERTRCSVRSPSSMIAMAWPTSTISWPCQNRSG